MEPLAGFGEIFLLSTHQLHASHSLNGMSLKSFYCRHTSALYCVSKTIVCGVCSDLEAQHHTTILNFYCYTVSPSTYSISSTYGNGDDRNDLSVSLSMIHNFSETYKLELNLVSCHTRTLCSSWVDATDAPAVIRDRQNIYPTATHDQKCASLRS